MHGCSSGLAFLVNAEVDSMGGVLDGGVGIGTKASPRRAAIEKAQSELRLEYDVRDERRRELEFLEKGGNPLDFKLGQAASVSVQSTSHTDQHPEQIVTSAAKGSFPLTTSPLGDSIESSGRPGGPTAFEPNSADNLLLFDGENELLKGGRNSTRPNRRNNIAPSEQSSKMDVSQNAKESEDSAIFRPYARRNRSRSNRDGARSSSTEIIPSRGGHVSSLSARHSLRDTRGSILETNNQKDQNKSSISNQKSASLNGDPVVKGVGSDNRLDMELNGQQETSVGLTKGGVCEGGLDVTVHKDMQDNDQNQLLKVDAPQTVVDMCPSIRPDIVSGKEEVDSAGFECSTPCAGTTKNENDNSSGQLNGFSSLKRDRESIQNEVQISCIALSTKNLDSESSCTQTSLSLEGNNESDLCNNTGNVDDNVIPKDQMLASEGTGNLVGEEKNETKPVNSGVISNDDYDSVHQSHRGNDSTVKVEEEMQSIGSGLQNVVSFSSKIEGMETNDGAVSETDGKPDNDSKPDGDISSSPRPQGTIGSSICEVPDAVPSGRDPADTPGLQTCDNRLKVANKAHEDSILEEARIIEAKRKRISELSVGTLLLENHRKSHWDFVLQEMAWLANDFAQERLWKITAASQISNRVALSSRSRFEEQNLCRKQKNVAFTLAKAVMHFWRSVEELVNSDNPSVSLKNSNFDLAGKARDYGNEVAEGKFGEPNMETSKKLELHCGVNIVPVKGYGVRFLKYNRTIVPCIQAEAPLTPDRMSDLGIQESSFEDHFTEECLFYKVSPGAMETYRKSIESCLIQFEKTGSSMMQEEVDTSMYDAVEELSQENAYDEEEGETSMYYYPGGFEGSKPSKFSQKKRKNFTRTYNARSYEPGADFPYGHGTIGSHQSILMGKRPANNLNVGSIPTKRVRTASRPRVQSPFSAGATGSVQPLNKTDASSGDTNSFQDDQSTLHSGPQLQKNLEVESVVDFEKPLPFDSGEISAKPKKKKKAKHLNSTYDQRWQLDSIVHNDQRENSKRRLESHHVESNGSSGLFGQHNAKKPKMMKQSLDNTYENISPMTGSIPSPVASQMSNMSNTNKFMKLIGGRDRGRKTKASKMPAGQPGSGSPWSLFEDQALVVLVHDMGPNWELVSDAINSTLQFKCIFRKPKECKERHKNLMDRTAGDGADSAEDSGSSQPYPSTLPGIPKGSARQLFQRLQGPMEEDTLKSHFDKIISLGQRQHYRRSQSDNQDLKQIAPVHNSHVVALSQVCPNNLNGGFLTPLDLCDASGSSPDVISQGYQGPHSSGLPITNQGSVAPILPASGANSSLQGSSSMVLGNNVSSPSGPINASIRDGRYGVPRTSLPIDEQQRLQQYNPMISGRNIQQSSLPVSGAPSGTDRGARILPGGNGMGMMSGMNRSITMSRPGFQGIASSSMLNSGSMLSSSVVGMPSPGTLHPGASSSQGNSMLRPRESLHMMRPGQNQEHQRQMMLPELQMQVTQGNSQGVPPFNGLSSNFSNQTAPPVPTYPIHSPQQHHMSAQQPHVLQNSHHPHLQGPSHTTGSRHPAYAQLKERQLHQQRMMQQQHHFSASNALMQHVQPQPQLPVSSSMQNNSQIQQTSQPVSLPSLTPSPPVAPMSSQLQQKHNMPPHGIGRNPQTGASGLNNQMGKQRQRQVQQQQFQQSGRHHPQQRQQSQSQQQAKLLKGMGRGNMLMHQNLSIDPSHLNGISVTPGSQAADKGEQVMHLMQGQGLYSGSGLNSVQPSRPVVPLQPSNQSQTQQKLFSGPSAPLSKQLQQMPSHSDNGSQGHVPSVSSGSQGQASHQAVLPSVMTPNHHHQQLHLQPHQKQANQIQPSVQRVLHQNHQGNSDLPSETLADQPHADQRSMNNASHIGTTTSMPQVCMESTNVTPAVSSSTAPQWKAPEPVYDSAIQNPATPLGSAGGPLSTKSSRSNSIPPSSQSLVQRQFSGGLQPQAHTVGEQWQQQQPHLKQPLGVVPPTQQHQQERVEESQEEESPQQQVPPHQSQQQMQHLQSGQGSLYIRPANS